MALTALLQIEHDMCRARMLCCFAGYIDAIDYKTGTLTIETLAGTGAKLRLNGVHLLI